MKKVEVHAFVLSVLAMATVNAAAEVVETTFPTRDVVIAERVLSPDGADDFAPALQGAIDDVAKNGGGVVFLKTGSYAFQTPVAVRRGVTVRGDYSPASPTKGTVLRLFGGRGDEEGVAAFSLENGSGLEGLVFFYPEQRAESPVAYPWTIRSLGLGCWLTDVNLGNSWQGVDFATHPSDGHRISYVSGGFFKTGVLVGNSKSRGWVEDLQFNPHYMLRLSPRLPVNWGPKKPSVNGEHPVYPFCRRKLRGIVLRDCADEVVVGTFLYAARDGISFEGDTRSNVLITGVDTACRGARLMLANSGRVRVALGQIVPLGADVEAAIVGDAQNRGDAAFMATQTWPKNPIAVNGGTGHVILDQANACGCSLPEAGSAAYTRLIHKSR